MCAINLNLSGSYQPPVCSWYTSMTSSCSISRALGVSSSLMRRPSKRKRRDEMGTPTRSAYDFFSLPICVDILTRKWISLESWPTTFSLMYSVSSLFSDMLALAEREEAWKIGVEEEREMKLPGKRS